MARCGQKVRLVAAVGADAIGERIRANLAAEGVETDGLWTWPGASDRCVICVDRHGENTIVSLIDAARDFDPACTRPRLNAGSRPAIGSSFRAISAPASPALAWLSPSRRTRRRRSIHHRPFPLPTTTGASSTSSFSIAAKRSNSAAATIRSRRRARCIDAGAETVVVTLGAEGSALVSASETLRAQASAVAAVDTVGAGDVFCGTLVAARAEGLAWVEALGAATRAAAICVTRAGVLASFPTRDEMADILPRTTCCGTRDMSDSPTVAREREQCAEGDFRPCGRRADRRRASSAAAGFAGPSGLRGRADL